MSTAVPIDPRNTIPAVLPNQDAARTRNSLRPESSTKTGDLDSSSVVWDAKASSCSSPIVTCRLYVDSRRTAKIATAVTQCTFGLVCAVAGVRAKRRLPCGRSSCCWQRVSRAH